MKHDIAQTTPSAVDAQHQAAPPPEPLLDGFAFRARTRLSTADDVTVAEEGETCERVDPRSLRPLLAAGLIAPTEAAPVTALPSSADEDLPRRRAADRGDR